ncbi:MAG: acetyltransferase [Proteobacteria bacterium]|nr:acetyltransferase [Pseudomonadota bacterium]MBU1057330.1 acetyltransferase [Pseudomonadota bacterium]
MHYDVFNGDADGICALHLLRLHEPRPEAVLITGVKRDINLLDKIQEVRDSSITVLDVSLDSNRHALQKLLGQGNKVTYIDHHFASDIPVTEKLTAHIDLDPTICTALIVDKLLQGKHRGWAVAAAFGDNFHEPARQIASAMSLSEEEISSLRELGELLNYNGYGADINDLHFTPDKLYSALHPYIDPFAFLAESPDLATLRTGFTGDMALAMEQKELEPKQKNRVYVFPNAPWARRVSGVFSNLRAREKKEAAHALIVENSDTTLRISVRAPLNRREQADTLCRSFPTGGGRAAAAGINNLPPDMLENFLRLFHTTFSR